MTEKVLLIPMQPGDLQAMIAETINAAFRRLEIPAPAADPEPGQLLSKKDAADLLGVSTSTIDGHARKGNLTRRYIGKAVRFERSEVLELAKPKPKRTPGAPLLNRNKKRREPEAQRL